MNSASMLLKDFIDAPSKAESILDSLTAEQVQLIEATIKNVKKRKLDKSATPPTSPCDTPETAMPLTNHSTTAVTTGGSETIVDGAATTTASSSVAMTIANALASAMASAVANSIQQQQQQQQQQQKNSPQDVPMSPEREQNVNLPTAEIKDNVEWVSFVYSHNRVMKNYTVRTDLNTIQLDDIDDKFKADNCVYPRANLPKDQYKGNRWSYETECNVLGWKLAWLNQHEISGKRGLIQRAVDSYRNRYPSMRSRRMARQAKLQDGTLRKRKQLHDDDEKKAGLMDLMTSLATCTSSTPYVTPTSLETAIVKPANQPKTIAMEDFTTGTRCRIKIHVETVSLEYIPHDFKLANSPFPRLLLNPNPIGASHHRPRFIEESICNELSWKLAWLNPKLLAGKKNMLQRAVDLFRAKFMPSMPPRRHSSRHPTFMSSTSLPFATTTLTQQNTQDQQEMCMSGTFTSTSPLSSTLLSPTMSCMSGTTASLDFSDCLSLADETLTLMDIAPNSTPATTNDHTMLSTSFQHHPPPMLSSFDEASASSSATCSPSPPASELFGMMTMDEMYDALMLPPAVSVDAHDTFMFTDLNPADNMLTATHPKLFESSSFLSSPSLPSSTLQQDALVKMENVDDFTCQLMESFF